MKPNSYKYRAAAWLRTLARSVPYYRYGAALLAALLICIPVQAGPAQQRVFDKPGGYEIGSIRDGDRVEILDYQTLYNNGRNQRWAYVKYSDGYSGSEGWINLENVRQQDSAPAPTQDYFGAPEFEPQADQSLAETSIRDMDINCYENARGAMQGCNLSVEVDIQPDRRPQNVQDATLVCKAELHWFNAAGDKQVATSQAQDNVNLYGGNTRRRLQLNFDFGGAGAKGATVENQNCQTQAYDGSDYYNSPEYRSDYGNNYR